MAPLRILITGPPGTGKTTLCYSVYKRLVGARSDRLLDGFLMQDRREHGRRVGFDCVALKDETQRAPLACADGPRTGHMVGKYHVQVEEFERFTVPILDRVLDERAGGQERIFIFDEIGKMELLSPDFISRIRRLLESKDPKLHVLGTVAIAGSGFIAQSKRLPRVELVEISVQNRDERAEEVAARFLGTDSGCEGGTGGSGPSPEKTQGGRGGGQSGMKGRWRPKAKLSPGPEAEPNFDPPPRDQKGVLAMGKASYGQLGRGDKGLAETSGDPIGPCGVDGQIVAASCGFDHTAIVLPESLLLCGRNNRGQCGRPTSGRRSEKDLPDFSEDVALPQIPHGLARHDKVKSVACGGDHTLVLMDNREVWACGDNSAGQLALGTGAPKMSSSLLPCATLQSAESVAAGFKHSAAICKERLYLWGANNQGQLGLGRRQNSVHEPVLVDLGAPVRSCALGRWHSLALTVTSVVFSFGWGRFGVLGQGDFTDHHSPVRVELPAPVYQIASGAVHCGAICSPKRQCFMWGRGSLGRSGMGSEANVMTPRAVPGLEGLAALALGGDFSAAVSAVGEWWLWGKNEEGQLGFGSDRENRLVPTRSAALTGFRHIALGDCHALAFR
ncbi:unnamed protein product [Durusdinium trenchii]|uniref:AAA+ ATPase domain-containing protein n=1 Tax=Durusdinium trenchii TaxID=1381693 RepID=A0ABP0T211_9DINO